MGQQARHFFLKYINNIEFKIDESDLIYGLCTSNVGRDCTSDMFHMKKEVCYNVMNQCKSFIC
jgi:hypothetical protein